MFKCSIDQGDDVLLLTALAQQSSNRTGAAKKYVKVSGIFENDAHTKDNVRAEVRAL